MTKHHDAGVQPAEIEITEEMIEAAISVFELHRWSDLEADYTATEVRGIMPAALLAAFQRAGEQ